MVNPMQSPTDFPFSGHVLFGFILSYLWGLSQYPNIPLLIVLPFWTFTHIIYHHLPHDLRFDCKGGHFCLRIFISK
jgi:fumarate reductase subunit D